MTNPTAMNLQMKPFYDLADNRLAQTLRRTVSNCASNRGRLLFVLRGIITHNPISGWGPATVKAFLCLLRGNDPNQVYHRKIQVLIEALRNTPIENLDALHEIIDGCLRTNQSLKVLKIYDPKRVPANRQVTILDWLKTLKEDLLIEYGQVTKLRVA